MPLDITSNKAPHFGATPLSITPDIPADAVVESYGPPEIPADAVVERFGPDEIPDDAVVESYSPLDADEATLIADKDFNPDRYYQMHGDAVDAPGLNKLARVKAAKKNAPRKPVEEALKLGTALLNSITASKEMLVGMAEGAVKFGYKTASTNPDLSGRVSGVLEAVAALDVGAQNDLKLVRDVMEAADDIARKHPNVGAIISPFNERGGKAMPWTPEEARESLVYEREHARNLADAMKGMGPATGDIIAAVQKVVPTAVVDPKQVENMSFFEDPFNLIGMGSGAGAGFAVRSAGRTVLTASTKEGARKAFSTLVSESLGKVLTKAGTTIRAAGVRSSSSPTIIGAMADLALGGSGLVGGMFGVAVPRIARAVGTITERVGQAMPGAKPLPGLIAKPLAVVGVVAKGAGAAMVPTTKTHAAFLGAAAVEIAGGKTEEGAGLLGTMAVFGVAGNLAGHAKGAAVAAAHKVVLDRFGAKNDFTGKDPGVVDTGDAALDPAHRSQVEELQRQLPRAAARFNWLRGVLQGVDWKVYLLPEDAYAAKVGDLRKDEGDAPGTNYGAGYYDKNSRTILLNRNLVAAGHEIGHALIHLMPGETRESFLAAIEVAYGPEKQALFGKYYDEALGTGVEGISGRRRAVTEEMGAEILSTVLSSETLPDAPVTAMQTALEWLGGVSEQLGLYRPQLGGPKASPLGVQPSAVAANIVRGFLRDDFLPNAAADARARGTLQPPELPGRPPTPPAAPGNAPAPAPAPPVVPVPPTPGVATPAPPTAPPVASPASSGTPPQPVRSSPPTPAGLRNLHAPGPHAFSGAVVPVAGSDEARQAVERSGGKYDPDTFEALNAGMARPQGSITPVRIEYGSVKTAGTPGKIAAPVRGQEQQNAYVAESMGALPADVRDMVDKVTVPYRWIVRGDNVNVQAMSPDKVVANARKIAAEVVTDPAASALIPYPTLNGEFTPDGWRQFVQDTIAYTQNQANGLRGDGQRIAAPAGYRGVLPPETAGHVPTMLSPERAQFINLTMALPPPRTSKAPKGYAKGPTENFPNVQAAQLRRAQGEIVIQPARTADPAANVYRQGGADIPIAENNPLRDAFAEQGYDFTGRELFQVTEEINLDNIASVTPMLESQFRAPSTDLVRAGFMPDVSKMDLLSVAGERESGLAFKKFFTDVTTGSEKYKPDHAWIPVMPFGDRADFVAEYDKHRGNFDAHIGASIPGFREVQVKTGDALSTMLPEGSRVLDIGASEGSWAKAVAARSDGRVSTVSLDPNPDMAKFFEEKSSVPGATYSTDAFHRGFVDGETEVKPFDDTTGFDAVHESMAFQFISPDRAGHVAEAKRLLKPGGLFVSEEKFLTGPKEWAANETKKDVEFKNKFFSVEKTAAKNAVVKFQQSPSETSAVGMVDNMVSADSFESVLRSNFKHVAQYWDSGNFRGYAASDNPATLAKFVDSVGSTKSKFSEVATPRDVSGELRVNPAKSEAGFMPSLDPKDTIRVGDTENVAVDMPRWIATTAAGKAVEQSGLRFAYSAWGENGFSVNVVGDETPAKLRGSITVWLQPWEKDTGYVASSFVNPEVRKLGIGQALYREVSAQLQRAGITHLTGDVFGIGALAVRAKIFPDTKVSRLVAREPGTPNPFQNEDAVRDSIDFLPEPKDINEALAQAIALKDPDNPAYARASFPVDSPIDPQRAFMPAVPDSASFKKWFEGSKTVDKSGKPVVFYHGTFKDFEAFDPREGDPSADRGKGIYLSNNPKEVSLNYANRTGPDVESKLDSITEKEVFGNKPAAKIIPAFVSIKNPVVFGGVKETRFAFYDPRAAEMVGMSDAVFGVAQDNGIPVPEAFSELFMESQDVASIGASKVWDSLTADMEWGYAEDNNGNLMGKELAREAFQRAGFDGIIDNTVYERWGNVGTPKNAWQKSLKPDTQHVIAFRPEQVKSATGNRGTYDPGRPEYSFMPAPVEREMRLAEKADESRRGITVTPRQEELPKGIQLKTKKPLEHSVGDKLRVIRYSSRGAEQTADPKNFGKGAATPGDHRSLPKTFWFLEGSKTGQDADVVATKGKYAYGAELDGGRIYDATGDDPLNWTRTINREEADRNLIDAGYAGLRTDRVDGAKIVALFEPVRQTSIGRLEAGARRAAIPKGEAGFMPAPKSGAEAGGLDIRPAADDGSPVKPDFYGAIAAKAKEIEAGKTFGATLNRDGTEWAPDTETPVDVVTLASENFPLADFTPEVAEKFLQRYAGLIDDPNVRVGLFDMGDGRASLDVNALVPQEHREASVAFARANQQKSIWDAAKGEVVETGGTGETVLTDAGVLGMAANALIAGSPLSMKFLKAEQDRRIQNRVRGRAGGNWIRSAAFMPEIKVNPRPESRVSPSLPRSKKDSKPPEHLTDVVSFRSVSEHPEAENYVESVTDAVGSYVGFQSTRKHRKPAVKAAAIIQQLADNIKFVWEQTTKDERTRWSELYDKVNVMSTQWAGEFGHNPDIVSAINARFSPQKDWYENVTLTRLFLKTLKADPQWTTQFRDFSEAVVEKRKDAKFRDHGLREIASIPVGSKLSELSPEQGAYLVRAHSQLKLDERVHDHELKFVSGKGVKFRPVWQSYDVVASVLRIVRTPTLETISTELGGNHKVRNFYNNHVDPNNPNDVTMDTHAVGGVALMRMLSSTSPEVEANFDTPSDAWSGYSGTYSLYADAYRQVAAELGVKARELQSVTWEKIREMTPPEMKRNVEALQITEAIWKAVDAKKLTPAEARPLLWQYWSDVKAGKPPSKEIHALFPKLLGKNYQATLGL